MSLIPSLTVCSQQYLLQLPPVSLPVTRPLTNCLTRFCLQHHLLLNYQLLHVSSARDDRLFNKHVYSPHFCFSFLVVVHSLSLSISPPVLTPLAVNEVLHDVFHRLLFIHCRGVSIPLDEIFLFISLVHVSHDSNDCVALKFPWCIGLSCLCLALRSERSILLWVGGSVVTLGYRTHTVHRDSARDSVLNSFDGILSYFYNFVRSHWALHEVLYVYFSTGFAVFVPKSSH